MWEQSVMSFLGFGVFAKEILQKKVVLTEDELKKLKQEMKEEEVYKEHDLS